MKLTNEDIRDILDEFNEDPDSKANKLRLLAAFFTKVAPMVGLTLEGDIVGDLMEWAREAHIEECSTCRAAEKLFSGSEDK